MTTKDYQLAADKLNEFVRYSRFKRLGTQTIKIGSAFSSMGVSMKQLVKALATLGKII